MPERERVREYQRPVKGKLVVELENGERWDAVDEDFQNFGLLDRGEAQFAVRNALSTIGLDVDGRHSTIRHIVQMHVAGSPEDVDSEDQDEALKMIHSALEKGEL